MSLMDKGAGGRVTVETDGLAMPTDSHYISSSASTVSVSGSSIKDPSALNHGERALNFCLARLY